MKWIGDKRNKEILTEDGYYLQIRFVEDLESYWWATFLNGHQIASAVSEKEMKNSLSAAQKAAQRVMIKHLSTESW